MQRHPLPRARVAETSASPQRAGDAETSSVHDWQRPDQQQETQNPMLLKRCRGALTAVSLARFLPPLSLCLSLTLSLPCLTLSLCLSLLAVSFSHPAQLCRGMTWLHGVPDCPISTAISCITARCTARPSSETGIAGRKMGSQKAQNAARAEGATASPSLLATVAHQHKTFFIYLHE